MNLSKDNKEQLTSTGIKIGIPVVLIGVGVFAVKRMLKGKKVNADGTSKSEAPALNNMVVRRSELTITPGDAALFANTLYSAMNTAGTDEQTIYSTIGRINNKDDMLLVIKTFGMKRYWLGERALFMGEPLNLIGWLRAELNDSEIAKIKPKFKQWGIPL